MLGFVVGDSFAFAFFNLPIPKLQLEFTCRLTLLVAVLTVTFFLTESLLAARSKPLFFGRMIMDTVTTASRVSLRLADGGGNNENNLI